MALFELNLDDFEFPSTLGNEQANFRFVVDIRYLNEDDELSTSHSVMPSLDTFWECDKDKLTAPNYVRDGGHSFNMAKIDAWDRLVLVTKANSIHSVQFKIFDVDRKDFWDKVKEFVAPIIQSLFGFVAKATTTAIPKPIAFLTGAFGTAIEDVESYALKKLANGEDRLLCKGTFDTLPSATGVHTIAPKTFVGSKGNYAIGLKLKVG